MMLLKLFWSFFQIGLFSIGGGYAAMPIIQHQVVEINGWLSMIEFGDVVTISQMTPGPIAINSATFVGTRIAGLPGAIVATIGCVTPSIIIVLTLAYIYYKYRNLSVMQGVLTGLRPAVVAMIASAGLSIIVLAFWNSHPPGRLAPAPGAHLGKSPSSSAPQKEAAEPYGQRLPPDSLWPAPARASARTWAS